MSPKTGLTVHIPQEGVFLHRVHDIRYIEGNGGTLEEALNLLPLHNPYI